jgi:peroxiredoxin
MNINMIRPALIFLLGVMLVSSAPAQSSIKIGAVAPAFSGTILDGTPYDLAGLRGNVVVMTFWSTRCTICHSELPKLNRLAAKYERNNVVFLALSMENEEKISGYLQRNPFRFTVMPNSFGVVLQYADRSRNGNIDMGFPSFFVLDQQGVVRHRSSGYDKTEGVNATVDRLLNK